MADNETIADIIAEMRGIRVREFQDYADRLDRARMKMEIEIANLRKENAKLREALVTMQNCDINKEEDCYTLYRVCEDALATTSNQNTQKDGDDDSNN